MAYEKFGLNLRGGVEAAELIQSGTMTQYGNTILYDLDIELSELEGDAKNILGFSLKTKKGSILRSSTVITSEPAAGGTSIDVGLDNTNGTAGIDSNGFAQGITLAQMANKGDTVEVTNGIVGNEVTVNGLFTCTTVGTFTAGRVRVRLEFEIL